MKRYTVQNIPRNIDKRRLYTILNKNSETDIQDTITDCFFVRDHKNGRGERDIGRLCFNWIADYHPLIFLRVIQYIPIYGRWDDLLYIDNDMLLSFIYDFLTNQLNRDYFNMTIGLPISTCAKWLPSEGKSFARHYKSQFEQLLKKTKLSNKEYRQRISTMRKYLDIPEHHLCSGKLFLIKNPTIGFRNLYKHSLKKDEWTFKCIDKLNEKKPQQGKRVYIKCPENYNIIINNLKIGSIT
jgi:hypothetical protein